MFSTLILLASFAITNAAQLSTALSHGELGTAFRLSATTVFPNTRESSFLVVRDETQSVCLRNQASGCRRHLLERGARITVSGKIAKDDYGLPCAIVDTLVRHPGSGDCPVLPAATGDLRTGKCDFRIVRLRGRIREVFQDEIDPNWTYLSLNDADGAVYVVVRPAPDKRGCLAKLNGATAEITGVCLPHDEGHRKITGRIVMISDPATITLLEKPSADPFDVPFLPPVDKLDPAVISAMDRHRIGGTVLAVCRNRRFLLRDFAGKLHMIHCQSDALPGYGLTVEVVGYPETDLYRVNLYDAVWQMSAAACAFRDDAAAAVSARELFVNEKGDLMIRPAYHGRCIRLIGIIQDLPSAGTGQGTVILKSGDFSIPVDISSSRSVLASLAIGCRASVAGTCLVEAENWRPYASFPHATGITLVVRRPSDVTVLSRPPWWTPRRFLIVVTSLLAVLLGVFIWNRWLNRLVGRRSRALLKERLALAEAELKIGERTRLAIELHDSLSQNLAAVACQVSAAKSAVKVNVEETMSNLNTLERMLLSCRSELRRCLWDLRNDTLDEQNMTEVIRKVLVPVLGNAELQVRFNVSRSRFDDPTLHSVVCIIRELVANAVVHGRADRVSVAGDLDGGILSFSVRENGAGFDPSSCEGPAGGHFGLVGVRERVERLCGTFVLESQPGKGSYAKVCFRPSPHEVEG